MASIKKYKKALFLHGFMGLPSEGDFLKEICEDLYAPDLNEFLFENNYKLLSSIIESSSGHHFLYFQHVFARASSWPWGSLSLRPGTVVTEGMVGAAGRGGVSRLADGRRTAGRAGVLFPRAELGGG